MIKNARTYQPKGGMCFTCVRSAEDCGGMTFSEMPILYETSEGAAVVKCINYERRPAARSTVGLGT